MAEKFMLGPRPAAVVKELVAMWPQIKDAVNRILTMRGDGVYNSPGGITIGQVRQAAAKPGPQRDDRPVRMKIKTAANSDGVAICNMWDGTTAASADIPVRMSTGKGKAGEELWATRCSPNAGVQYSSADVAWIEVAIGETGSPTTIAPTGSTANATTWSIQADGTPLTITIMCRIAYDTSAHKLYGFNRTFARDTKGRLLSVSAETRVDVDTLESC